MITPEFAGAVATLVGAGIAILAFVWRIFKVTGVFLKDHEEIKVSIETIRAEVTPNSGKSLKDTFARAVLQPCQGSLFWKSVLCVRVVPSSSAAEWRGEQIQL